MESLMIKELMEGNNIIDNIIKLNNGILDDINLKIGSKNIILTGMGSSFFIAEIGEYFFKHLGKRYNIYSYSSSEVLNKIPFINGDYIIITFSQSGNTKEVSEILKYCNENNIESYSIINNLNGTHSQLSKNIFNMDIGTEQSPVSTKYIMYSILFIYKLIVYKSTTIDENLLLLKQYFERLESDYKDNLTKLVDYYKKGCKFLIIGNGLNNSIGKEISLKIRETVGVTASYDDIGQLKHGGVNSIDKDTICILLDKDIEIEESIIKRGGQFFTVGEQKADIIYSPINPYIDTIQKIYILQFYVHILATKLKINTDIKLW